MAESIGYSDTPFLPGTKWRVHDGERPQPRIVAPGKTDTEPPSDAVVLFDGSGFSNWTGRDGMAQWKVENGYMEVTRTGDIETKLHFGDCQLHLEWAAPAVVEGNSQGRGNSGVFLMGLYEIQVLDCYDNKTYPDGTTAALYGQYPPLANVCRKPGEWQSYEVVFIRPRWEHGKLVSPAYMTVFHNGILVHLHQALMGPTGHRIVSNYDTPHADAGPLKLQDHGNPGRFRNIWVRPIGRYDQTDVRL
ncbi:MAG: DUF1080 domain-containing protein [candidate division Zixibacteria bacterium]|nr:DUF1080 domain-containing protein [candidate division Zixibacteria bacterium]